MFSTPHLCVQFAEAASGGATVMLSGSIDPPFNASRSVPLLVNLLRLLWFSQLCFPDFSIFGSVEVPRLAHPRVGKLTVVLVTPENPR